MRWNKKDSLEKTVPFTLWATEASENYGMEQGQKKNNNLGMESSEEGADWLADSSQPL